MCQELKCSFKLPVLLMAGPQNAGFMVLPAVIIICETDNKCAGIRCFTFNLLTIIFNFKLEITARKGAKHSYFISSRLCRALLASNLCLWFWEVRVQFNEASNETPKLMNKVKLQKQRALNGTQHCNFQILTHLKICHTWYTVTQIFMQIWVRVCRSTFTLMEARFSAVAKQVIFQNNKIYSTLLHYPCALYWAVCIAVCIC